MKSEKRLALAITIVCVSITAFCMPVLGAEDVQVLKIATGNSYESGIVNTLSEPFEERYNCMIEITKADSGASLNNDFAIMGHKNDSALVNETTDAANAYKKIAVTALFAVTYILRRR